MLDLVKSFGKYEKEITTYVNEDIDRYDNSTVKSKIKKRFLRLRDSNDMLFGGATFKTKVAFPIVKQRAIIREGILTQNFRGDPLITVQKAAGTSAENAKTAQDLLTHNFRITRFRYNAFRKIKASAAKYGSAVCVSNYNYSEKIGYKTIKTELGYDRVKGIINESMSVGHYPVHILNYIQDPDVADPQQSTYRGYRETITLAELKAMILQNPENYIEENVKTIYEQASKEHKMEDKEYYSDTKRNMDRRSLDIIHLYNTCNIKGNEENQSHYYMQLIAGKIIRFQDNPNDKDIVPISIFNYYPREDSWAGNADSEFFLPHENFINLIMGMKAENAINAMQQYIFHGKGTIDKQDWDNRHTTGGIIGVDLKDGQDIKGLLYGYQFPDNSLQSTDSIIREVNENMQSLASRPNFYKPGAKTGMLQNTTATAAGMMEEQGDIIESAIVEAFEAGLIELANNDIIIAQQRFSDAFKISPAANEADREILKEYIFGDFNFKVASSFTKNRVSEMARMQNLLTGLMNFRGTQDPSWMQVNMLPLIRYFLEMGTSDVVDIDEVMPVTPQAAPGYVPTMPQPQNVIGGAAQPVTPQPSIAGV